jgi:rfaE bifunctional protein kinase chain/domain/rfaE bifunctional protein nucleotidyltransferase chain/domain
MQDSSVIGKKLSGKIKTLEELCAVIGPRPRRKSVIMCHGTFDIVHPGHIRHLMYARDKGDILVVSVTSDQHISKANFRPYVPEALRAFNLASLEMVDYVIIDTEPKPLRNLKQIQPDFYAKGFEYANGSVDPRTQEEIDVLDSYGGRPIFTPGDVVYSSSAIIDRMPPNIGIEKLRTLMDAENIDFEKLRLTVAALGNTHVHVVGDTIIDVYTHTELIGSNAKTPTFSVRYDREERYVGGAGIVAKHLRAAGAEVTFTTMLGGDELGVFALNDLTAAGVKVNAVIDTTRPTTCKNAFIAGGYRLLKVDTVDNRSISGKTLTQFLDHTKDTHCDALIFSDFRHGIFNHQTIPQLTAAIPVGTFRVADSQVASRWGNILEFKDFDLITPNEKEARFSLGDQDSVIRPLALKLYNEARCKTLILKLGSRGMITYRAVESPESNVRAFFVIDSLTHNAVDPVGAGDALVAYSTLALATGNSPVIAAILGSTAAALECEIDGNSPVPARSVLERIDEYEKLVNFE